MTSPSQTPDGRARPLAILLAIALVARVAWWVAWIRIIESDGVEYARLAQNLMSGRGMVGIFDGVNTAFPPFYPLLIGAGSMVVGDGELAGRLISLMAGLGLVAVSYLLAREIFGQRTAILAGTLAALHPVLVALSVSVFSESLTMFLVLGGLYLIIGTIDQVRWRRTAGAGLAFGLACLTRPETIAFAAVAGGLVSVFSLRRRRRWGQAIWAGLLPVLIAAAIGAPYAVYLAGSRGKARARSSKS
jgi:4-amino-4-deoxy-L-arabinose transferase-like glycosyltransferase